MGMDLIQYNVWYESEGFEPDWDAGENKIKELFPEGFLDEDDPDYDDCSEGPNVMDELETFKSVFEDGRRDTAFCSFSSFTVMSSGGPSWGDSPTDMATTIGTLDEHNILEACGFYNAPDYKKILGLVMEKAGSKLLPLLMGLDPDLDRIVTDKLKGE